LRIDWCEKGNSEEGRGGEERKKTKKTTGEGEKIKNLSIDSINRRKTAGTWRGKKRENNGKKKKGAPKRSGKT